MAIENNNLGNVFPKNTTEHFNHLLDLIETTRNLGPELDQLIKKQLKELGDQYKYARVLITSHGIQLIPLLEGNRYEHKFNPDSKRFPTGILSVAYNPSFDLMKRAINEVLDALEGMIRDAVILAIDAIDMMDYEDDNFLDMNTLDVFFVKGRLMSGSVTLESQCRSFETEFNRCVTGPTQLNFFKDLFELNRKPQVSRVVSEVWISHGYNREVIPLPAAFREMSLAESGSRLERIFKAYVKRHKRYIDEHASSFDLLEDVDLDLLPEDACHTVEMAISYRDSINFHSA